MYSETTYGKYTTNHNAISGLNTFDENVKTVNANIRRKVKSGRYIAVLDIYPDNVFISSTGACICVYFFEKSRFNDKTHDELIRYARYGY